MPALWLNEIVSLTRARSIVVPAVVVLLVCLRSSPPAALGHDDHGPRDAVVALGLADAQPPAAVAPAAPTQIERVQAAANVFHTALARAVGQCEARGRRTSGRTDLESGRCATAARPADASPAFPST